jgi:hypothetical protein
MMLLSKMNRYGALGYVVIKVTGEVEFHEQNEITLSDMQNAVGGPIEAVPGMGHRVWVNKEGIQKGLDSNAKVPSLLGNVLVCGFTGSESITQSVAWFIGFFRGTSIDL